MRVPGVMTELPWWNTTFSPSFNPPTAPSPNDITNMTQINYGEPGLGLPDPEARGLLDHLSPTMAIAGLIVVGAMRLHPVTAPAALIIGVGRAAINWGSAPAGAENSTGTIVGGGGGRDSTPHWGRTGGS